MITIKTSIVIPRECISFLSEFCPFYAFYSHSHSSFFDLLLFVRDESAYYAYNDRNDYLVALAFCFVFFSFFFTFLSFLPIYEQSALQGKFFLFLGMNSDVNNLKYKELGRSYILFRFPWIISQARIHILFIFCQFFFIFGQEFFVVSPGGDTMGMDWISSVDSIVSSGR